MDLDSDEFIKGLMAIGSKMVVIVKCKESYFAARGGPDDLTTGWSSLILLSLLPLAGFVTPLIPLLSP